MFKDLQEEEISNLRVMLRDIVELNAEVTFIVICPSQEQTCVMQFSSNVCGDEDTMSLASAQLAISASSATSSPTREQKNLSSTISLVSHQQSQSDTVSQQSFTSERIFLPVQVFEALNFHAYDPDFIRLYANISIQLDIESNASVQFSREAITKDEINR